MNEWFEQKIIPYKYLAYEMLNFNSTLETFHTNQSFSEVNLDVFEVAPAMSEGREDLDGTTFANKLSFYC